jgi:hypothetical protein
MLDRSELRKDNIEADAWREAELRLAESAISER